MDEGNGKGRSLMAWVATIDRLGLHQRPYWGSGMTDEERQKLCEDLRRTAQEHWWADHCEDAADEIERLAKENVILKSDIIKLKSDLDDERILTRAQAVDIERLRAEAKKWADAYAISSLRERSEHMRAPMVLDNGEIR